MSIRASVWVLALVCVTTIGCLASTAYADYVTVADWQFNSTDDLLVDSSGNGHALVNSGTVTNNAGSATFDGTGMLSTDASLNLTSYSKVRVSWSQNAADVSTGQIVWGHTPTAYAAENAGAIVSVIGNIGGAGTSEATINNYAGTGSHNVDTFAIASETWQNFVADYDLTAANVADIVKVYQDGTLVGAGAPSFQCAAPASFRNDKFFIGAQGGIGAPFTGEIGYLKIEGQLVPEPGTLVLLTAGLVGLICYAWRKRG